MKVIPLWCKSFIVLLWSFLVFYQCEAQLVWDRQSLHVVATPFDTDLIGKFLCTNAGKTEVRISPATDCGCLTLAVNKEVLLPGDRGEITANFTAGDRIGIFRQTIKLNTNPLVTNDELIFEAEIPRLATVSSSKLWWKKGERLLTKEVTLSVANEAPIKLVKASASDQQILVDLVLDSHLGRYLLKVTPQAEGRAIRAVVQVFSKWTESGPGPPPSPKSPPIFSVYVWVD